LGHLVEGNPDDLVGWAADENGEILDEDGDLIGRVELMCPDQVEESAGEAEPIGGLLIPGVAILRGREINENGKIFNDDGEQLGQAVEGCDPQHLSGKIPNELGQVLDITGEVIGHVEPVPGEAANIAMRELEDKKSFLKKKGGFKDIETEEEEDTDSSASQENSLEIPDISTLHGLKCTKFGYIVGENGVPVGELIEGNAKKLSQGGFQLDDRGQFWDNHSNVLGIAQAIPIEEEDQRLFADFEDLFVVNDGWVENATGDRVGRVVDGEIKKLLGRAVDDDGDVLDKRGNVIGHAEPWEEPEPETENFDFSFLEGLSPNNLGFVLRSDSVLIGRVTEGNLTRISGRTIDLEGQIWSDDGEVIGRVEIVPEEEREVSGLFSDSGELMVRQDGLVETEERMIVGRTIDGDLGKLRGKAVDDDGDIMDKHGNVIGFAEPYIPPDNPREPEEDTSELEEMSVNNFESVESETETEPELSPEESERQAKEKHNRDLSKKISTVIQQTLDSMEPPYKQITAVNVS
jgi:hypothetical protein